MVYIKDSEGNEKYKLDGNNNEQIDAIENRFARDKNGNSFYPRDLNKNEFKPDNLEYIVKDGVTILPVSALGKPIYPKEEIVVGNITKFKEVYPKVGSKCIIGKGIDDNQYYTKDENGNEYYPDDKSVAFYSNGRKRYPTKSNGDTVFRKDQQNNEEYLEEVDPCHIATIPSRYAKDNLNNEFYPKRITADGYHSEAIILDKYAKDNQQKIFYPKDAFQNEFYLPEKDNNLNKRNVTSIVTGGSPIRYAQTNDAKIIVPSLENSFTILPTINLVILETNQIGRLIREGTRASDFLTNVDGNQALKSTQPTNYRYRDTRNWIQKTKIPNASDPVEVNKPAGRNISIWSPAIPFFKTGSFWILLIVSLIIKSLALWWFFIKNKTIIK